MALFSVRCLLALLPISSVCAFGPILFTDVTGPAGLSGETYSAQGSHGLGVNWIDYDRDGWCDVFAVNGLGKKAHLYHNNHDGTFTKTDGLLPALPNVEMMGSVFADYDNDGDSDLFIYTDDPRGLGAGTNALTGPAKMLLRNLWIENGGQTNAGQPLFTDVAAIAGVQDLATPPFDTNYPAYRSSTACWLDYDRDGWADLYVGHWVPYVAAHPGSRDRMYRNLGNGTFLDTTDVSGINPTSNPSLYRPALACLGGHLDGDLWPDLYVANVTKPDNNHYDVVFSNRHDGTFRNVTAQSPGVGDDAEAAMGVTVADFELDGDWDVYISDLYDEEDEPPPGNVLYKNKGTGLTYFDNVADSAGVASSNSWGVNFFDADQDGYEDLFVGAKSGLKHFFYLNLGNGTFSDLSTAVGFAAANSARGSAVADYDQDGDLDLLIVEQNKKLKLYKNVTANPGHWFQVRLAALTSNRDAIGALVKIQAGGKQQMRQVLGGTSTHSQEGAMLHFGLGTNTVVDWAGVFWPSGVIDQYFDQPADAPLTAMEQSTFAAGLLPNSSPESPGASWLSVSGMIYRVQHATRLNPPDWTDGSPPFTSSVNGVSSLAVDTHVEDVLFIRVMQVE